MQVKITQGVKISVETFYQNDYSRPEVNEFNFAYRITIENLSENTVMLMRRHWHIFDSSGSWREVEGEGVVGQQPVIHPGQSHVYVSGCSLKSEIGTMHGYYTMIRLLDNKSMKVNIPAFQLIAPGKLN